MKKYLNTIKISSFLLLIFPFLGFSELWENMYVIILGFIIGSTTILLHHKSGLVKQEDEETSLQEYVQELKDKFKEQIMDNDAQKSSRISDVNIDHE
jgi:hypothetical protein